MARSSLVLLATCGIFLTPTSAQEVSSVSTAFSSAEPFFSRVNPSAGSDNTSNSFASIHSPDEQVAVVIDYEWIWERYYTHLMSRQRKTPFLVYFTDKSRDCDALEREEHDEEAIQHCRLHRDHTNAVSSHLEAVIGSTSFPSSRVLPVVHISTTELPQVLTKHRVPSTPSLMWFPPRSTGKLQRYAHAQTNFLAFNDPIDAPTIGREVVSFLRTSYTQSRLSFPTSNSPYPQQPVAALEDTLAATIINALPFLAIFLYALLLAFEHRVVVLRVLQNRFTWIVLSQFVLYVSLSGLFHAIIHRVALFYAHPHFGVYFIHPSGRKQFFLEGLVNGGWSFVISFALFSVVNVMPKIRNNFAREEILRWALMAVGVSYFGLYMVFMAKHPWLSR